MSESAVESVSGKTDKYDLTRGSILAKLLRMSIPAIGSQLVHMAYSFADMFWLGRISSGAVAASGTVGIFLWLSMSFDVFGSKGAEIGIAQNLGRGEYETARGFLHTSMFLALTLGILCGAGFFLFRNGLIGFFHIQEAEVSSAAVTYLAIVALGIPFTYINSVLTSAFNASGNSALPFYVNLICLAGNAILDPILITTANMGIAGAAWATSFCQILACVFMLIALKRYKHPAFVRVRLWGKPKLEMLKRIARWGTPLAFESFCFTFFVIIVSRFVAGFGSNAMAVQRIGNQVDQFSYLISAGFGSALSAFIGQNFGAERFDRISSGFRMSTAIMSVWGVLATLNLLFFGRFFFTLFVPNEPTVINMGVEYLRIIMMCQIVASLEGVGTAVFRGLGETLYPAVISISTNVLRVALAFFLSRTSLAQNGIWLAMAISAFLRGAGAYLFSIPTLRKQNKRLT
ncbi:MAG: MATE family efflux transporter [Oscillospiraceae bacterium]|jgi:putative MATE family efflux protein|nr:MATE family efflux transporter [Oscillospiraceae bacterium]